jgi:phosphate uptake regulator
METRNIQKTGGSSFTITLPKSWVVQNKLEHSGVVEIHTRNSVQLVIQPNQLVHNHASNLAIDYLSDIHIIRELIGMYISGADEIVVTARSISYEQRSIIRTTSFKLIGFELFEESSSRIVLKNVANPTITAPEYLKKMYAIINSMFSDIVRTVETSDRRLAKDIIDRDVEVDRIHLVILRQFNSKLNTMVSDKPNDLPIVELQFYELAALRLERIADHIVRIALMISMLKDKEKIVLNKFEHADLVRITEYLDALPKIIFTLDKRAAHAVLDIYDSRKKNEFINRTITNTPSINILIQDSIERLRSYVSNIAEETINYVNMQNVSLK